MNWINSLRIRRIAHLADDAAFLYGKPGTEREISVAEAALGVRFHEDYRQFLLEFGGAVVGACGVCGVTPVEQLGVMWSVVETTLFHRKEYPQLHDAYAFSDNLAGSPYYCLPSGEVRCADHDSEDYLVAPDFGTFVLLALDGRMP